MTEDIKQIITLTVKEARHQFEAVVEDLEHKIDVIAEAVLGHTGRFDQMDERFDGIDVRLDGIDIRLDGIDVRLDGIDTRLDGIDGRLEGVESRLGHLEAEVSTMRVILGTSESPNFITREEYTKLDMRLKKIEEVLAQHKYDRGPTVQ